MKRQYLNEQLYLVDYPSPNFYYGEIFVDFNGYPCDEGFTNCNEDNISSDIKAYAGIPKRDIKLGELIFLAEMSAFCFLCNDYERVQNILLRKIGFDIINRASVIKKSTNEKYTFFSYMTTNKHRVFPFNYEIYMSNKDASIKRLSFFCTRDKTENLYPINPVSLFDILINIYLDINNLVLGEKEAVFLKILLRSVKNSLNIWNTNIIEPMFFSQIPSFQERNKILQIYNELKEGKAIVKNNIFADFLERCIIYSNRY